MIENYMPPTYYVVIGSSRGLGAALTAELLKNESYRVIGVARTKCEELETYEKWRISGRYRHIEVDITSSECPQILGSVCIEFAPKPICVIFNAALVASDVNAAKTIHYEVFEKVNRVGIDGLAHVLQAFENYLLTHGGSLVGISSFSAFVPSIFDPRVAYPATKAYLEMTLRCLRIAWRPKVKVVTVHLGHIGQPDVISSRWLVPSYEMAAARIIQGISARKSPDEINYPLVYTIMYKYMFAFLPDRLYVRLLTLLLNAGKFIEKK